MDFLLPYEDVVKSWRRAMGSAYVPEKLLERFDVGDLVGVVRHGIEDHAFDVGLQLLLAFDVVVGFDLDLHGGSW